MKPELRASSMYSSIAWVSGSDFGEALSWVGDLWHNPRSDEAEAG